MAKYLVNGSINFAIALLFFCSLANAEIKLSQPPIQIEFVSEHSIPPMMFEENGELKGVLIDVVRAVSAKLPNYHINITPMAWSQAKAAVKNGQSFGLVGSLFHAHDWPTIYPYSYPIIDAPVVTVCHKDLGLANNAQWPQDYAGLKIGTVSGFDGWRQSGAKYRAMEIANFFEFPNSELALLGVKNNIVNCTLFGKYPYAELIKKWQLEQKTDSDFDMEIVSFVSYHSMHIGYSEKAINSSDHPHARDFIKAFDSALFQMLKSEELAPILKKYDIQSRIF